MRHLIVTTALALAAASTAQAQAPLPAEANVRAALGRMGKDVTSMGLDYVLWNRGQERYYKTVKPRHRARTVYY